jgi:putative hydrolases of HD superfamily
MEFYKRIAHFLYEVGTMRRLPRMHRQTLLIEDCSDTIASHSYRTALIGWFLAKREKVDPYKVVMMCLLHDIEETRTGDHNWVHKRYVKVFTDELVRDQLGTLPYKELQTFYEEYMERTSKEALVAKEADRLDQILLLREYEWQGSREATLWLHGKKNKNGKTLHKIKELKLKSAKDLARMLYKTPPSDWWEGIWTSKNR